MSDISQSSHESEAPAPTVDAPAEGDGRSAFGPCSY